MHNFIEIINKVQQEKKEYQEMYLDYKNKNPLLSENELQNLVDSDFKSKLTTSEKYLLSKYNYANIIVDWDKLELKKNGNKIIGIFILQEIHLIEDNGNPYFVVFKHFCGQKWTTFSLKYEDTERKTINVILSKNHIIVQEKYLKDLSDYLQNLIVNWEIFKEYVDIKYVHEKIGFDIENDPAMNTFYHIRSISRNENAQISQLVSNNCPISQKGSLEQYLDMLKKEVKTPQLQLAFALGCTGIITAVLQSFKLVDNLFVNLVGKSSTGKTTAGLLAMSVMTTPNLENNSLCLSSNSTDTALLRQLKDSTGFTYLIDDFSAFATSNSYTKKENLIYSIAAGTSKVAVGAEKVTFKGTIIGTSEETLCNESFKKGAFVRLTEFNFDSWTESATNSDNIKETISENYGVFGPAFVEFYLRNYTNEETKELFKQNKKTLEKKVENNDNFTERSLNSVSVIMLTVEIINKYFNSNKIEYSLNYGSIFDLCINTEKAMFKKRHNSDNLFEKLQEFINLNSNKFIHAKNGYESKNNFYGRIIEKEDINYVYIISNGIEKFERKENAYIDHSIFDEWIQHGYLEPDASFKINKRVWINGCQYRSMPIMIKKELKPHCDIND